MRQIYLDYNATTPVAPSVLEVMQPFFGTHYGNPSSRHALGRAGRQAVEDAREQVADLLGATPDEVVFTSGGTESDNLAIQGSLLRRASAEGSASESRAGHIVISSIEHPAVSRPAHDLARWFDFEVTDVPCNSAGVVPADRVEAAMRPETRLVSIMHANNEVGTIQPIAEIVRRCRREGVLIHTDAAQSVGKIPVDVGQLGVDLLSIAGHKFYGPKGIGALYVRSGTDLSPILHGADHEQGLRSGTENVPAIVGLGHASHLVSRALNASGERLKSLRDRLQTTLHELVGERFVVLGEAAERLPNTLGISFPNVSGDAILDRVPELCASTGAACHSGSTQISSTLQAMAVPAEIARGSIRLSLGWPTSQEDVDLAGQLLAAAWEELS